MGGGKGNTQVPGLGTGWRVVSFTYVGTQAEGQSASRDDPSPFGCVRRGDFGMLRVGVWLQAPLWERVA